MVLPRDIPAEDLKVFLQEADEHLQTLDSSILHLERSGEDPVLIQEIFRSAHTIKGSSAMMGYAPMADLAHAMESLLDRVRKGTLPISTALVDALLHSLDALRALKDRLEDPSAPAPDIRPIIAELARAQQLQAPAQGGPPLASAADASSLTLTAEEADHLRRATAGGLIARLLHITIAEESGWPAVRCFQALQDLALHGEIIASRPTAAEIETGEGIGHEALIVLASSADEAGLRAALRQVQEIAAIEFSGFDPDAAHDTPGKDGGSAVAKRGGNSQSVRIDVSRLDEIMNMIGELVIDRTRLLQVSRMLQARYRDDDLVQALTQTSGHIIKVVDDLQEDIMQVRMLPVGTMFNAFPRMMRDLANSIGKKVEFTMSGQETEIDRTVIQAIRDPLVHILRNAVDHGVESPAARLAAGKPESASVTLSAWHEQGNIMIQVQDDGAGIDAAAVKEAAVRKGLLSQEEASQLSEQEALDLIFLPGNSTAQQTTEVSGRGVGMDIVKTNIESINGFVSFASSLGKGTTFTLRLPLTLATVQALLVSTGRAVYAIPLVHVLETVRLDPEQVQRIGGREVMRLRQSIVSLVRLTQAFGLRESDEEQRYVAVVKSGEKLMGLVVESLIGQQEVVVKALGGYIGDIRGVAGASVLGDGSVVLIVDVPSFIDLIVKGQGGARRLQDTPRAEDAVPAPVRIAA